MDDSDEDETMVVFDELGESIPVISRQDPPTSTSYIVELISTACGEIISPMSHLNSSSTGILSTQTSQQYLSELIESSRGVANAQASSAACELQALKYFFSSFVKENPGFAICTFFKKAVLRYYNVSLYPSKVNLHSNYLHSLLLEIHINFQLRGQLLTAVEKGKLKTKLSRRIGTHMQEIGLVAYPIMHIAGDFQLSSVQLSQYIDTQDNDGSFYPPLSIAGVDLWFKFIIEQFNLYICSSTEAEGGEDYYCWAMTTPYHAMGANFPMFATGKIRWIDPADAHGDILIGLLQVREGLHSDLLDSNRMNVYIDTKEFHPALSGCLQYQSKGFYPNEREQPRSKQSRHFEYQSSRQMCAGIFHYKPGGECGTIAREMKIVDVGNERPFTKSVPQPTAHYHATGGSVSGRGARKEVQQGGGVGLGAETSPKTSRVELDNRAGGKSVVVVAGKEGKGIPSKRVTATPSLKFGDQYCTSAAVFGSSAQSSPRRKPQESSAGAPEIKDVPESKARVRHRKSKVRLHLPFPLP